MARTNLLQQSEAVGATPWTQFGAGVPITANAGVGPMGGPATAIQMAIPATAACGWFQVTPLLAAGSWEFSVWAKLITGNAGFAFNYYDGDNDNWSAAMTATSAWLRFLYTFTSNGLPGTDGQNVAIGHNTSQATAGTIQFWGAQLNPGSSPNQYIPTTTATKTNAGGPWVSGRFS